MYWTNDNNVVKVQKARQSSNLYGKLLIIQENSLHFEYKPGILRQIKRRMTLDEAIILGKQIGYCCVCGLTLTNELSVELGIGPICRGKI